eukprot:CAMPEP_0174696892 /NCGR_PEP_ID=MMETSP1094-20130205/2914_1 /TAXON_ID=156173 /ORGANISM="Chrysochromulina brevifilum, Strain UTEX LB 985" /LENGTH=585 /DNA_ID=CAMNT_0015893761 /DNA_START=41 /DNA_END=1798 /DNA_ORIENTATION=-
MGAVESVAGPPSTASPSSSIRSQQQDLQQGASQRPGQELDGEEAPTRSWMPVLKVSSVEGLPVFKVSMPDIVDTTDVVDTTDIVNTPDIASAMHISIGSHAEVLKGEDGLRVERVIIGGHSVLAAMLVDGHGGHEAAAFVLNKLLERVIAEAGGDASGASLSAATQRSHAALHKELLQAPSTSGTTVTLCLVNETLAELTVCNVGDSFAILVPRSGTSGKMNEIVKLTASHRLNDSESERHRVRREGGKLGQAALDGHPVGPIRAFPGGVCCSRALGDRDCGPWLSPIPFTSTYAFPLSGAALIIASDGLWDSLSDEIVADIILSSKSTQDAAQRVVAMAIQARGLRDDTTCICIVGKGITHSRSPSWETSPQPASPPQHPMGQTSSAIGRRQTWEDQVGSSNASPKGDANSLSPSRMRRTSWEEDDGSKEGRHSKPHTQLRRGLLNMIIPKSHHAIQKEHKRSPVRNDLSTKGGTLFSHLRSGGAHEDIGLRSEVLGKSKEGDVMAGQLIDQLADSTISSDGSTSSSNWGLFEDISAQLSEEDASSHSGSSHSGSMHSQKIVKVVWPNGKSRRQATGSRHKASS